MPRPPRVRVLTRKLRLEPRLCILVEDGNPCHRPAALRGLCYTHYAYLSKHGGVDQHALPQKRQKLDLRPHPNAQEGVCAVLQEGVPCTAPAKRRGLCMRHYAGIWQRPDLNLDDFSSHADPARLERKRNVTEDICAVRERTPDGQTRGCTNPIHLRGVCRFHYRRLSSSPEQMREIADAPARKASYRLKKDMRIGICVAVENDVGCDQPSTSWRRLCRRHRCGFDYAGILHELTDQFKSPLPRIEKRRTEDLVEGTCCIVVNGVPCKNIPKRRGICARCLWSIEKQGLSLEDFALPVAPPKADQQFSRRPLLVKKLCLLVVNGAACDSAAIARGLCRRHYGELKSRKLLGQFALTEDESRRLQAIPHWYFDKNVVIDYARHDLFRDAAVADSVALVTAVLLAKVQASVSLDCVRAVYTYLGHRFARPMDEDGHGLDPAPAERKAREYVRNLFFQSGGMWHFVPYSEAQVRACTAGGRLWEFSLEDALEIHLFARARAEFGATLFITADHQLLDRGEGVHPRKVVEIHPHIATHRPT